MRGRKSADTTSQDAIDRRFVAIAREIALSDKGLLDELAGL
jgi:hypothetical protein